MKQGLQLKLSQQLAMTPQLQQAIRLLQLSTLELKQELELALENNPLLEVADHFDEVTVSEEIADEQIDTRDMMEQKNIPDDIPLDASLDDIYTAGTPSGTHSDYRSDELPVYQGETIQTLQDYLNWQLDLTPFTEQDRVIATSIIEAIDERGYLTVSLKEILDAQGNDQIEQDEVEAVLKRIQHFDPIGVGARDLQECLSIQLNQLPSETSHLAEAKQIVDHHLVLLGQRDFRTLKKILSIREEALKEAVALIQQLNPYPGESISTQTPDYIIPDILVKKIRGRWHVLLSNDNLPNLRINQQYAALEKLANETDGQFIRAHLQEANWLIKSVENRQDTLLRVSHFIVEHQQAFFEFGDEHMKPMVLSDVADAIDMHESTISRITTQKYLQCPRGIFELKYFFSSHVNTQSGGEASSTAIRAFIKKMIAAEDSQKPLSDSKIASLLEEQGLIVARRTVAKYRESLSIPPSNQRKQL
ncbi:RNA polymerase factor sigma-54 [Zophobihabitans entericus]|uniref:RNA polymerase sigma-54 factor n=1 Tax=Zophobihabitans entericus TaxID=1635327 RepID=A0A6G9IE39_9GAMM|nr:RNA polymerase factor sigma-54 [Zophobihabitans entericus]